MAEQLKVNIIGKDSLSGPAKKASAALSGLTSKTTNSGKATRNANNAFIELGRGVSDVQFGFVGLGNNLQRMLEIFGNIRVNAGSTRGALKALGSAILGPGALIALVSSLIAFAPQITDFFRELITGAAGSSDAIKELNKAVDEFESTLISAAAKSASSVIELETALESLTGVVEDFGDGILDEEEGVESLTIAMQLLKKHGIDPSKLSTEQLITAIRNKIAIEKEELRVQAGRQLFLTQTTTLLKEQEKIQSKLTETEDKLRVQLEKPKYKQNANAIRNLVGRLGDLGAEFGANKDDLENLRLGYKDFLNTLAETSTATEELTEKSGFKVGVGYSHGFLSGVGKITSGLSDIFTDIDQKFVAAGIERLGTAIGSAISTGSNIAKNAGRALLGILGDLAIKIGTIILATGLGLEGLKVALTNPFVAGAAAIAKGILLISAGAALKGIGGGSGSTGSSGGSALTSSGGSSTPNPVPASIQGDGSGFKLTTDISSDNLRFIVSRGNSNYAAYN